MNDEKRVISTEAYNGCFVSRNDECEVEKSVTKQTDVSTEFILSVVEGLDMTLNASHLNIK